MIELDSYDNLLVQCKGSVDRKAAIGIAQNFCMAFRVKSIIVQHNDYLIQVTNEGVHIPEDLRRK